MKFLFALLVAATFFTISSCGGEKKKEKPKTDNLVEVKNGVYTEYYPKRTAVKFQGPQDKNGQRDGRWFFFSEKGTEQSTTEYSHGKKNGLIMVRYPTGNVRYTGFYENDQETGSWRFYKEDGSLDFEKNFDSIAK